MRLARQAKAVDIAAKRLKKAEPLINGESFYFYQGEYPQQIAEDVHFCRLYQQWKKAGGKEDDPLVQLLRARWNAVMSVGEA